MNKIFKLLSLLICVMLTAVSIFGCSPSDTESPDASSVASSDVSSDEKDAPKTLNELLEYVINNCLPPLSELSEPLAPGDITPVENLRCAPQDTVGQKLSLERSAAADSDILLYRYTAETKQLVILVHSRKMSDDNVVLSENAIMVAMDTEYADTGVFLQGTDFVGTVTDICIIDVNEFVYASNSFNALTADENIKKATADSAVCYGTLGTAIDGAQPIEQFESITTRFGIKNAK